MTICDHFTKAWTDAQRLWTHGAQELITDSGLKEIASYADAVGPDKGIIVPTTGGSIRFTTDFVERYADLPVHALL
jgi:glycerophosphoryl diester phosphodiesterase